MNNALWEVVFNLDGRDCRSWPSASFAMTFFLLEEDFFLECILKSG